MRIDKEQIITQLRRIRFIAMFLINIADVGDLKKEEGDSNEDRTK